MIVLLLIQDKNTKQEYILYNDRINIITYYIRIHMLL